jgi:hypothetical protein
MSVYKECLNLREEDVTEQLPGFCGKVSLLLRDFTHNGENIPDPHPAYLQYYAKHPFWVQVVDEDDLVFQKEFATLQEAQVLFDLFLSKPDLDLLDG